MLQPEDHCDTGSTPVYKHQKQTLKVTSTALIIAGLLKGLLEIKLSAFCARASCPQWVVTL